MKVSVYWLAKATRKHPGTIRKRISDLDADKSGKYDSAAALEAIYVGRAPGENGFISTPEAVRLLTIEKQRQIALQNEITRGERIPIEDVNEAVGEVFDAMRGIIKAALPIDRANEVFDEMRRVTDWIQQKANEVSPNGNGQFPAA